MIRSMYSGVAGMKAHQTRMDVIGNNIANVNTYGFKASRATFRDMYYQNINGAAAASGYRGGINPSSVGYGSKISSIDLLMGQSTMTSTGNPLDVAITGEGFFQVMDSERNIFYTKAGMLDIDAAGNLVDTNGYLVLGVSGDPTGKAAGREPIQFQIDSVSPAVAKLADSINGKAITISATNETRDGNVSFSFSAASNMPIGQRAEAVISGSSITIRLNANETFSNVADLQSEINDAIYRANGSEPHPAGQFNFTIEGFAAGGLTGAEIVGTDYNYKKGSVDVPKDLFGNVIGGGFNIVQVGDKFSGSGATSFDLAYTPAAGAVEGFVTITVTTATGTYTANIKESQMASPNNVLLSKTGSTDSADNIMLSYPDFATLFAANSSGTPPVWVNPAQVTATDPSEASTPSNDLGLKKLTSKLMGGTTGGDQTIKDLTGISIGADGTIVASHAELGIIIIGRIDLATFDNPRGLQQSGSTYFAETLNSGKPGLAIPGEGGTGGLANTALEMSNVDLSQEFSDMITTQRGFQANSRLITVSDTMLEELINLKR